MLRLATGWDVNFEELLKIGERSERIFNLKRVILDHLGITRKDDKLPERLLKMSLSEGGTKGHIPDLETMLDDYYQARGWDLNGIPTHGKLKSLDTDA